MRLYDEIKNILGALEKNRVEKLNNLNSVIGNNDYSTDYKNKAREIAEKEYKSLLNNTTSEINRIISSYKNNILKIETPSTEQITHLNTVIGLVNNISLNDNELLEVVKPFKNNMLLMGLLHKKFSENSKQYNITFEEYKAYADKNRAINQIKDFENHFLNETLYNGVSNIKLGIYLNNLQKLESEII